jgi:hypothetical protein
MKRIFSSAVFALAAGLGLRLFFALKFPADSGDTVLYEQIAANWLKHGVYAMDVHGAVTPVDLRMPGYPAFLAFIYALTARTGEAARLWVMLAQVFVDLLSCLVIAALAAGLLLLADKGGSIKRVFLAALWLAALCPFTANYTAVLLTETIAIFWTAAALLFLIGVAANSNDFLFPKPRRRWEGRSSEDFRFFAPAAGLAAGLGTLFRPETPLLSLLRGSAMLFCSSGTERSGIGFASFFSPPWAASFLLCLGHFAMPSPFTRRNSSRRNTPLCPEKSFRAA